MPLSHLRYDKIINLLTNIQMFDLKLLEMTVFAYDSSEI